MTPGTHPRRPWRSTGAVLAGVLAVIVLSTVTDVVMHATGVFPPWFQPMADPLWLLATAYRFLYGVAGGWITARLAPDRPMRHTLALGVVGLSLSIVGVAVAWGRGPEFGPAWFSIGLVVIALPTAWLGGALGRRERATREVPRTASA